MPMLRSLLEPEDDAATRAFFTELLTEPMPPPRVPPSPRGPERVWRPPLDQTGTPLGTLIERHPAYGWGLEDLPVMTVRQAHRTWSRGRFGKFASRKTGRSVRSRNSLEFDLHHDWEVDPTVVDFVERPVRLRYVGEAGKPRHHVPAAAVRWIDGTTEFVDLTWEEAEEKPARKRRWERVGRAYASLGCQYRVLTDLDVRRQPRLTNIQTLFRSRQVRAPAARTFDRLCAALSSGTARMGDLPALVPGLTPKQVPWLILRGILAVDLELPLVEARVVRLAPRSSVLRTAMGA